MAKKDPFPAWLLAAGPLAAYGLLSLVLTWPLVTQFLTHVPGDGIDDPSLAWNLWWVKHALVDYPQNPFAVDWQFWPVGINLAFYTLTVLNGMLSVPLQAVLGVVPAYNLLLLSSFVLSGYGAYLLCMEVVGREGRDRGLLSLSAFLGGALYAFASAKLFYAALGQGNIASSQWIPFAALYLIRALRPRGRLRDAALAALFIVLQAYAELTYASFLLIFAGLVVLWAILRWVNDARRGGKGAGQVQDLSPLVVRLALCGILVGIGIAPILANMLPDLATEGDFFTSGGGFADIFSADLVGYALPTQLHPVIGHAILDLSNKSAPRADGSQLAVNKGQQIYIGYVALILALSGLWRGRRRGETWFWGISALLFFLLTLGPSLRVNGHDLHIPLPFTLVAQLPFLKGNRYPSRYSVMLLMTLAPLVAMGGLWAAGAGAEVRVGARSPRPLSHRRFAGAGARSSFSFVCLPALLLAILLFEHLSVPLPLSDLRIPALYGQVASTPGDFALLELPPGWRNGARVAGKQDVVIMQQLWNQTAHGKRLLGGNTSRNPEFKFQFFSEDLTLARLIATTNAADVPQHAALRAALAASPVTPAEAERARAWAATWNVRQIMVHRDKLPPATEEALRQLLPVSLIGESGNLALYALTGPLAPPTRFAVATDGGSMVLAEGWSPPGMGDAVYAQRQSARLLLPIGPDARQLQLYLWALMPRQEVTLVVDGGRVASQPLTQQPGWLTFDLPPDPARPPLSDVRLQFSALTDMAHAGAGTGSLVVRSGGQETGDFAHIYVNGIDRSPNQRGYNLVALDGLDGRLLRAASFDTHADPGASHRLAEWVKGLPAGAVVAGSVRDEASMSLGQEAIDALRSLGSDIDLRGRFRWGHAFIGAVGMSPASAEEQMSGIRIAQVHTGLPATAERLAAAFAEAIIVK